MSEPIPKAGAVDSPTFLGVARRVACFVCNPPGEDVRSFDAAYIAVSEPHHFPPKGNGGAQHRDDLVIPLCRKHHGQAQRYEIDAAQQYRWVHRMRSLFLELATPDELRAFTEDLIRHKQRPLAVPF